MKLDWKYLENIKNSIAITNKIVLSRVFVKNGIPII
jgi:hypothetical protein